MTYSAKPHQPLTLALQAAVSRGVAVSVVVETPTLIRSPHEAVANPSG